MQLYGSKRTSRKQCKYGCCGAKEAKCLKHTAMSRAARKIAKRRARQQGRKEAEAI